MKISDISQYTEVIRDVSVSLGALTTAIIAAIGYSKWRKELKGKSEYEKAKEILRAVYRVRDGFSIVRNSFMYEHEYPGDFQEKGGFFQPEERAKAITYAYENRWKKFDAEFAELERLNLDAIVEWGSDFSKVIIPLREKRMDLLRALQRHLRALKSPAHRTSDREAKDEEKSVLYEVRNSELDLFTPEIDEAVALYESKLRRHIEK